MWSSEGDLCIHWPFGRVLQVNILWAPEWRSGLRHCISTDTLVRIQAVSQLAVIGSPKGLAHSVGRLCK